MHRTRCEECCERLDEGHHPSCPCAWEDHPEPLDIEELLAVAEWHQQLDREWITLRDTRGIEAAAEWQSANL